MKARRIFRGTVAGLMSLSLLLSGMPVSAAEVSGTGPQQKEEVSGTANNETDGKTGTENGNTGTENTGTENGDTGAADGKVNDQTPPADSTDTDGTTGGQGNEQTPPADSTDSNGVTDGQGNEQTSPAGSTDSNGATGGQGNEQAPPADSTDSGQNPAEGQPEEGQDQPGENQDDDKKDDVKDKDDKTVPPEEKDEPQEDLEAVAARSLTTVGGRIEIDGDLSDWAEVTSRSTGASGVDSWKVAYSPDGNTLYFSYTGTASTEWDYGFAGSGNAFQFEYPDGSTGENSALSVTAGNGETQVKNAYWGNVAADVAVKNSAHGNNPGPYVVEFAVPLSYFQSPEFTLTFGGTSVAAGDIEQVDGNSVVVDVPAVYGGITIDGSYSDWAAVAKTEVSCPNDAHKECLSQVAAVYDGDWFYIYIKDGKGSNASGAGTHSNGKFAITSDLGYETDIQLTTAPAVNGVNGAQVSYVGDEWELAIPKDQLPKYRESLSFGLYLGEPFISGIMNLQEDSENNLENLFDGINYDGNYEDWEDYGHSTIEYATAGSQEDQIDAKGALYSSDGKLYGHVVTTMPQHLEEAGGEFTAAVTIAFNQSRSDLQSGSYDQKMAFYPMCVTVDGGGNINWSPQLMGLPEGTYEFYIASRDAWRTSANINNLHEMDLMYGKMIMTVGKDGKDEMEFYLDLPMVAQKLGVDETDLKEISAQFGRIGQQWIFTAGTSTGPIAGVILCISTVGIVLWYKKRKKNELQPAAA